MLSRRPDLTFSATFMFPPMDGGARHCRRAAGAGKIALELESSRSIE